MENKERACLMYTSLLVDIDRFKLEQEDIVYIIRDKDNLVLNWLYDPDGLDGFFDGVMEKKSVKELSEELAKY